MANEKNWKNEITMGLAAGIVVGMIMTITALSMLKIWHLLLPQKSDLTYATIIIWVSFATISSVLYYQRWAIYNLTFTAGLFMAIGLINHIYNIYGIGLPYDKVVALVAIGLFMGLMIKIILDLKIKKQITQ